MCLEKRGDVADKALEALAGDGQEASRFGAHDESSIFIQNPDHNGNKLEGIDEHLLRVATPFRSLRSSVSVRIRALPRAFRDRPRPFLSFQLSESPQTGVADYIEDGKEKRNSLGQITTTKETDLRVALQTLT